MKIRMITILVLAALLLSLFTACNDDEVSVITAEEAQKIALEDAGLSARDVSDIHTHVSSYENVPCYSVHITIEGTEYEYMIAATTGEVLYADDIG